MAGDAGSIAQFAVALPGGMPSALSPPAIATGDDPKHIALTADGRFAYATAAGDGLLYGYRVGRRDGRFTPLTFPPLTAGLGAHGVGVTPDDSSVYVANQDPGTVSEYDLDPATGALIAKAPASVASGAGASGVAIAPDGRSVYVTNLNAGSISQYDVDPATGALSPKTPATVPAPASPGGVGVSPDGRSLYVATLSGRLAQFTIDPATGRLRPKRPATVRVGLGGLGAAGVAITPDGRFVYVPNAGSDTVSQFSVDSRSGALNPLDPASVPAGDQPEGVVVTPNGRALYAENAAGNTVSWFKINRRTGRLHARGPAIASGPSPHGAAVTPDRGPRARFRIARGDRVVAVGERARFNAAPSRDPDGFITRYRWRFGDHRGRTRGAPTARHRYRRPGRYSVRLVVTDDEGCSTRFVYTGQTASCDGGRRAVAVRRITVRRHA